LLLAAIAVFLIAGCANKNKAGKELTDSGKNTSQTKTTGDDSGTAGKDNEGSVDSEGLSGLKTIYFDFDKYNLMDDAKTALDRNAKALTDNPRMKIVIQGHCDERGTVEYNLALGEKRANSARDYLIRLGIDASRISVLSYGKERPAATGHDEDSWSKNRRAEFVPK
jgi:peptidoglycan-associated lipoprotein